MADLEKVLKGLECCCSMTGEACRQCPYDEECAEMIGSGSAHLCSDALELLKQEEEVPVIRSRVYSNASPFSCGNCGSYLMSTWIACPMCGRKVKWK